MRSLASFFVRPGEIRSSERIRALDAVVEDSEHDLWRRHLHMGIGSFVLGALALLAYIGVTPHSADRGILMIVDIAAIIATLAIIGPVGVRSLTAPWREIFFFSWSVGTVVIIAVALSLDGGAGSPLAGLLVLPVLFGGLLYRLPAVVALAGLALGCFGVIFLIGSPVSAAQGLATAAMIAIAGGISAMGAMNRYIWDQERQSLTESLHGLATHDGLTGCLNYQAFQEALVVEFNRADRYERPVCVVIADLDGFKAINDTHGHGVGDTTLASVGSAMLSGVRLTDLVGRIGGDEFAVLLPETSIDEARRLVERIRTLTRSIESPAVTLSFGVSIWQGHGDSPEELLRRADSALYEAKRLGRNGVVLASEPYDIDATALPIAAAYRGPASKNE